MEDDSFDLVMSSKDSQYACSSRGQNLRIASAAAMAAQKA
jgi:hypothetical protein